MRLTDQPSNHASYHGKKEGYSAVLLLLQGVVKGPLFIASFPPLTRSSFHSSSSAMLPNTRIHPSPTRARAMLPQPPGTRHRPRCHASARDCSCSLKWHSQFSHLSHHCEKERGGSSGSNDNFKKRKINGQILIQMLLIGTSKEALNV